MPVALRIIVGSLLVLLGLALVCVAVLGARTRLRRNRWAGVHTAATLRSDASFALANRAAAVPLGAAGLVALAGGAVVVAGGGGAAGWVVLVLSGVGTVALAGVGGRVGDRVAAALVPAVPGAPGCTGTCAGCDLVAGCRQP